MNILAPIFSDIPEFLLQEKYWCIWPAEPKQNGGISKRPLGSGGYPIGVDNLKKWISYDNARAFYEANNGKTLHNLKGPIAGIGVLFHDSSFLVGIDLDHILAADGTIAEWAQPFIEDLKKITYLEVSPSGTGLHAYLYGEKPKKKCKGGPDNNLEVYEAGRYFTVTGRPLNGCQNEACAGPEAQALLDKIIAYISQYKKQISTGEREAKSPTPDRPQGQPETLTDSELLDKIRQSKQGQKFSTLYDSGDISGYGNDHSAGDQALCNILASWTGKDASRMDALMRQSALLREPERIAKWEKVHSQGTTYGDMTIAKAIQDCRWCYEPKNYRKKSQSIPTKATAKSNKDKNEFLYSENVLALIFEDKYRDTLRYDHTRKAWYGWNGTYWQLDETGRAFDLIRKICSNAAKNTGPKETFYLQKASTASAVNKFAQHAEHMAVTFRIWDSDDFLLGTPGGTVDLHTGQLMPGKRENYITRITSVTPTEKINATMWLQFLNEATEEKRELQRFMQQIAGMCLTGSIRDHALFFVYGPGGNGKSVFLQTLSNILGQYAITAQMETFTVSKNDRHPAELAALNGARLVTVSETEEGRAWAEVRIKNFTGGDKISARYMRGNPFEFQPKAKLVIIGNHKPELRNVDEAMRRRINVIPFIHKPENVDTKLPEKLRDEYPSILRWMIDGCLDWQRNGLQRPDCVKEATEEYFDTQDIFGQWLDECCTRHVQFSCRSSQLFNSWKEYAESNNVHAGNSTNFAEEMKKRGFEKPQKSHGIKVFHGITLKDNQQNQHGERGCPDD